MAKDMKVEDLMAQLPKMMRIADDLHDMAGYINDLRIITIVMTVAGVIGGIGFFIYKLSSMNNSNNRDSSPHDFDDDVGEYERYNSQPRNGHGRQYYHQAKDAIDGWELKSVKAEDPTKGGSAADQPEKSPAKA